MKKKIERIHFITHAETADAYITQIKEICEADIGLLQLRIKNLEEEKVKEIAIEAKKICTENNVCLIINDYVDIAFNVEADGVHLGKHDMSPDKARLLLGKNAIIGCTANSFKDIIRLVQYDIDYIGLGPFAYTSTKEALDKILGIETFSEILQNCKEQRIDMPIIAVGGIKESDVPEIFNAGAYGIATSSMIANAENKQECINKLKLLSEPLIGA